MSHLIQATRLLEKREGIFQIAGLHMGIYTGVFTLTTHQSWCGRKDLFKVFVLGDGSVFCEIRPIGLKDCGLSRNRKPISIIFCIFYKVIICIFIVEDLRDMNVSSFSVARRYKNV
jgi:hypothetical protein